MFDVSCCSCCREEEPDWLDCLSAYTRSQNVTEPWSLYFFIRERNKRSSLQIISSHALK